MSRRPRPARTRRPAGPAGPAGSPLLLTPADVSAGPVHARVGGAFAATVAVVGYPRQVGPGWLEPLLAYPGRVDVALHVDPLPTPVAVHRLRRQLGRLESGRRADLASGKLLDPTLDAAASDAADLAGRLARGESRLFTVGLYLTVHAHTHAELDEQRARVTALAHSLLLAVQPATYRALAGWATTLPLGVDQLRLRRTVDTPALAAGYPFTSPDLPVPDASRPGAAPVVAGQNTRSGGLVVHDRWAADNYNTIVLARSGAGKSYYAKLDLLRTLYTGAEAFVVDPEDEYAALAGAVGGTRLDLGAPGVRLNPLDLPAHAHHDPTLLTRRALFCQTLAATLLAGGDPDTHTGGGDTVGAAGRAALDRAVHTAYTARGITADPASWRRPAPLLADVTAALDADRADPAAQALAARLAPYTAGSYRGLFDGPTSRHPGGHLTVFSLRALPEETKPAGMLLTLDAIWRQVADPARRRRRLVVVDEAWLLAREHAGARFLSQLAKAGRKHWAGLTVVTQDTADLLGSQHGRAVVANAATHVLLAQDQTALAETRAAFGLSDGQAAYLLTAPRGCGLLLTGRHRVPFRATASAAEHSLVTTDPAELARQHATPAVPGLPRPTAASGVPGEVRRPAPAAPVLPDDADPC